MDVKPLALIEPDDIEAFDWTSILCEELGWGYFVVSDISESEGRNLRFLSGYRYERWRDSAAVEIVHSHAGESTRLSEWASLRARVSPQPLGAVYSASSGLAPEGVVILLGGPLVLSAVAAAATVFMSGGARERELALIQAAGSTQPTVILTAFWEAVIYTVTAAILGAAATVIGGIIIAAKLALTFPVISFSTLTLIAAGGFILILAATVAPTAAALRREIPRTLAVDSSAGR